MKDPQDCTYPHAQLCLRDCKQECQKRSGWRKKQIDDAEEEAWKEMEKKAVYSPFIVSELWRLSK
jgi:hypothetical protein